MASRNRLIPGRKQSGAPRSTRPRAVLRGQNPENSRKGAAQRVPMRKGHLPISCEIRATASPIAWSAYSAKPASPFPGEGRVHSRRWTREAVVQAKPHRAHRGSEIPDVRALASNAAPTRQSGSCTQWAESEPFEYRSLCAACCIQNPEHRRAPPSIQSDEAGGNRLTMWPSQAHG
jgi:hypothetical protein